MIREIDFQNEAVDYLCDISFTPDSKQTVIMKAPTGSGKTVILIKYINKYLSDYEKKIAFVWICPGKGDLEEQSRRKMNNILPTRKTNDLFDALTNGFEVGSTTFLNWERITKKDNIAISEGEKRNLYEWIAQAHKVGISFILIIDEEHSNNTARANDIINCFSAKHIIRVSATTVTNSNAEEYEIDEQSVIDEGLITTAISVNEGIKSGTAQDDNILLELADKKRKEIFDVYAGIDKKIRPLVLIQFPNGNEDKIIAVEEKLRTMGYTRENKMVAAWLSGDKEDIPDDLVKNDSQLSFLFIKQAINTGWDCPRAKILVKLREGGDEAFQIQTIGRIRRMPEGYRYGITVLDLCYVYTFDNEYKAGLLSNVSKAYIPQRLFLKDKCKGVRITKELRDMDGDTADLRTVYNIIKKYYDDTYNLDGNKDLNKGKLSAKGYKFDKELLGSVISGVFVYSVTLEEAQGTVDTRTPVNTSNHGMQLRHTMDEFKKILGIQQDTVRQIMDRLFCFKYRNRDKILSLSIPDYYAFIINNVSVIKDDLRNITAQVSSQNRILTTKTAPFSIPLEEFYHFDPLERDVSEMESNAYKDYSTAYVTSNCGKSSVEIKFENYCETNKDKINWIYKNGDSGQQYLSIAYFTGVNSKQRLFYPDYILEINNEIWIIETKGGQKGNHDNNIDKQVENKFDTFKRYAEQYKLQWGFVRDMNEKLYINNTEYQKDLHASCWKLLDTIF